MAYIWDTTEPDLIGGPSNSRFRKSAKLNVVKFSHLPIEGFHGAEKLHLE
jgi:hypothetical protein